MTDITVLDTSQIRSRHLGVTGALTITRHMVISRAERGGVGPVGQNMRVRKLLIGAISAVTAVVVAAVGVGVLPLMPETGE